MQNRTKLSVAVALAAGFVPLVWQVPRLVETIQYQLDEPRRNMDQVAAFADIVAPDVTASWDPTALVPYAAPEYFTQLEQGGIEAWKAYRALGARQHIAPCTVTEFTSQNGVGSAIAHCPVVFEAGAAVLLLNFGNLVGNWKLTSLTLQR